MMSDTGWVCEEKFVDRYSENIEREGDAATSKEWVLKILQAKERASNKLD
jgi:hypothetical protein